MACWKHFSHEDIRLNMMFEVKRWNSTPMFEYIVYTETTKLVPACLVRRGFVVSKCNSGVIPNSNDGLKSTVSSMKAG